MKNPASVTRRGLSGVVLSSALLLIALSMLVMSLLTGCAKDPKPEDTTVPSTAAPTVPTTAAPETTPAPETLQRGIHVRRDGYGHCCSFLAASFATSWKRSITRP